MTSPAAQMKPTGVFIYFDSLAEVEAYLPQKGFSKVRDGAWAFRTDDGRVEADIRTDEHGVYIEYRGDHSVPVEH